MDSDLIKILIALVVIVFSFAGKSKKNKQRGQNTTSYPTAEQKLEDLVRQLTQTDPPERGVAPAPVQKPPQAQKVVQKKSQYASIDHVDVDYFENLRKSYQNKEFSALLKQHPLKQLEIFDNFDDNEKMAKPIAVPLNTVEDARKAIVYSEIFNRKYI
jgi:hypothetical protein